MNIYRVEIKTSIEVVAPTAKAAEEFARASFQDGAIEALDFQFEPLCIGSFPDLEQSCLPIF
jgi:hypothetical protein